MRRRQHSGKGVWIIRRPCGRCWFYENGRTTQNKYSASCDRSRSSRCIHAVRIDCCVSSVGSEESSMQFEVEKSVICHHPEPGTYSKDGQRGSETGTHKGSWWHVQLARKKFDTRVLDWCDGKNPKRQLIHCWITRWTTTGCSCLIAWKKLNFSSRQFATHADCTLCGLWKCLCRTSTEYTVLVSILF